MDISFSQISSFLKSKSKQASVVYAFVAILLALLVWEILVVKDSVRVVLELENQQAPVAGGRKGVRVNFTDYDQIIKRVDQASVFKPTGGIAKNPFAPIPPQPSPSTTPAAK